MPASPLVLVSVNSGPFNPTGLTGLNVAVAGTIAIVLQSPTGVVDWYLQVGLVTGSPPNVVFGTGTDELQVSPPTLTGTNGAGLVTGGPTATVTFTFPGAGSALLLSSTVTGTFGTITTTFSLFTPTGAGYRVGAAGLSREGSNVYGWTPLTNAAIRHIGEGGGITQANILYVSLTGSDVGGDGSIGNPFATYAHAASVAITDGAVSGNNYVVSFAPGTYVENVALRRYVTLAGYDAFNISDIANSDGSVILSGTLGLHSSFTSGVSGVSGVRLDGNVDLNFVGISSSGSVSVTQCTCGGSNGVFQAEGGNIELKNVVLASDGSFPNVAFTAGCNLTTYNSNIQLPVIITDSLAITYATDFTLGVTLNASTEAAAWSSFGGSVVLFDGSAIVVNGNSGFSATATLLGTAVALGVTVNGPGASYTSDLVGVGKFATRTNSAPATVITGSGSATVGQVPTADGAGNFTFGAPGGGMNFRAGGTPLSGNPYAYLNVTGGGGTVSDVGGVATLNLAGGGGGPVPTIIISSSPYTITTDPSGTAYDIEVFPVTVNLPAFPTDGTEFTFIDTYSQLSPVQPLTVAASGGDVIAIGSGAAPTSAIYSNPGVCFTLRYDALESTWSAISSNGPQLAATRINSASAASSTLSSFMNALTLPGAYTGAPYFGHAVLVASAVGFASSGTILVTTTSGPQIVSYTSISGNAFLGCTGGTGTMSTGGAVKGTYSPQDPRQVDYLVDSSGGAFTMTVDGLITPPGDSQFMSFKDSTGAWATNNFTIAALHSTIENPFSIGTFVSSISLAVPSGYIKYMYDLAQSKWMIVGSAVSAEGPVTIGRNTFNVTHPSPATVGTILSEVFTGQTTSGSFTGVVLATIPLPGTSGAPATTGVLELDCEVSMVSTTTTDAARFKLNAQWSVRVSGSPVAMGSVVTTLSTGTNGILPPTGWSATLQLDGGNTNAQIVVNGDPSLTVNCKSLAQWGYSQ